eukprot:5060368-Prorocentrum_lima.AAC.1
MTQVYKERKVMHLAEIILAGPEDPRHQLIFVNAKLMQHPPEKKRVGRPRLEWVHHTMLDLWRAVTNFRNYLRYETFRPTNAGH